MFQHTKSEGFGGQPISQFFDAATTPACNPPIGPAIVVPKENGDYSGVPEFLRKRLRSTPNKRHSTGRIGDISGGGADSPPWT